MTTWKEPIPSAGKWEVFYLGAGEANIPAEEARELVARFGFVQKYSILEMERNTFQGGERHFWPKECPCNEVSDFHQWGG